MNFRQFLSRRDVARILGHPNSLYIYASFGAACFAHMMFSTNYMTIQLYFVYILIPVGIISLIIRNKIAIEKSYTLYLVLIYIVILMISTIIQNDAQFSMIASSYELKRSDISLIYAGFVSISIALLFIIFISLTVDDFSLIFLTIAIIGMIVSISALFNSAIFIDSIEFDLVDMPRMNSTLGMPPYNNSTNISATYAIYCSGLLGCCFARGASTSLRAMAATGAAMLFFAVVLTQSRGGILAIACAIAALCLATPSSRRIVVPLAVATLLGALAFAPDLFWSMVERGMSHRPEVWRLFADVIAQRPFTGHGGYTVTEVTLSTGVTLKQAHNLVLSAMVRGGIAAALTMAALLGSCLWWAFRYHRLTGNPGPLCAIAALVAAGMVDYQLIITLPDWYWVTFWLPMAICVACEVAVRRARDQSPPSATPTR